MPQPLSSVKPYANVFVGNNMDSPARNRPELALLAMNVVAEWSILESFINGVFVALLRASPVQAASIFATIRSQQGQRDAFMAVVDVTLPDQGERDIIMALLKAYERASKVRNRVAHWVWGHSPDLPDAVLLANPASMAAFTAEMAEFTQAVTFGTVSRNPPAPDNRQIYVYDKSDFTEASERIQRVMFLAGLARSHLSVKTPKGAPGLLQLSNEPEIRVELERLKKDRQIDNSH